MKKTIVTVVCLMAMISQVPLSADAEPRTVTKTIASAGNSRTSLKQLFSNSIGQYPYEVKLLSKPALKKRLVALMGASRYNFMLKNYDVQTPVEFNSRNYHASGCQTHGCGYTEFEISYNPEEDALAVRYMVEGHVQIFKEKKSVNAYWDY